MAIKKTKARRDAEILAIGNQMSNVLFNLKQRPTFLTDHEKEQFNMLQTKWDVAKFQYLKSFKRARGGTL